MLRSLLSLLLIYSVGTTLFAQKKSGSWEDLDRRATDLYNNQKYEESLQVFLLAVPAAKQEFGVDNENYAGTVSSVAVLCYYTGKYPEAEKYYNEALAVYEKIGGKNTGEYEATLTGLIYLYQAVDNSDKLVAAAEALTEVTLNLYEAQSEQHFTAQKQLAGIYMDRKQYNKAEKVLLEGRTLATDVDGPWRGDFCALLFQLYAEQNQLSKAEPFFHEAKQIRNKSQQEFWKTIDFRSITYQYEIDDQETRLAAAEAQAEYVKGAEPGSVNYARTLINLATLYQTQENLKKAGQLLTEAKTIIEQNGSVADLGTISGSLGYFYEMMGNNELSGSYYREGLGYTRKVGGREDINYGTACHNLSMYNWRRQDLPACEMYERIALLIYASQQSGYTYYASAATGLAQVYDQQKDYAKAEAYQKEAVNIIKMAFGDDHYTYAAMAVALARIYEKQKRISEAEELFVKCKNIEEKVFGKDHVQYAGYCHELGQFYMRQGQYTRAVPLFREAVNIKLKSVHNNFGNLSETEKKDLFRYGKYYVDNYVYCLLKAYESDKSVVDELYNTTMATKGLIFQSTTKTRANIMASGNQELIKWFREWTIQRDHLAKVYAMSLDQRVKLEIDLPALEADANQSEKKLMELAAKLDIAGLEGRQNFNWTQLKGKLKPDEAGIEIIRSSDGSDLKKVIYAALVVTGSSDKPQLVVLPNGFELETKDIRYYHNAIQSRIDDTVTYRKYWRPIAAQLKGIRKIYFSPAGVYHQISLPTLKNRSTGKYLMDEHEFVVVGNTADLLKKPRKPRNTSTTYLLGFPDYQGSNSPTQTTNTTTPVPEDNWSSVTKTTQRFFDRSTGKVTPLPGTLKEVETIQAVLKKRNMAVSVFTGGNASEEQLKKISNPAVLHIATHGFFMPDQKLTEAETIAGKKAQDPLLRSGLLLAGCEPSLKGIVMEEGEDGILSAYEAINLFLDNTELVILSACETGLGEIDNGEGVYGLQRSFQQAGARLVLVSLWKVDDEATALLMSTFYEAKVNGASYEAAFSKARAVVRQKYPDPYYWGAFVLIGS